MSEESKQIRVLLVEDDAGDANLIQELLGEANGASLSIIHADQLSTGLKQLSHEDIDVLLLDLSLPDSQGPETFATAYEHMLQVPIIVLTGLDDENLAIELVKAGAQDYLCKGEINADVLTRAIRYAIERHRLQQELLSLSLTDELTGLYNRRGFQILAEQQLKVAIRSQNDFLLLFIDLNGLKQINDTFSHNEGDLALISVARILKGTFRSSDIIARYGGDEFTILAIDVPPGRTAPLLSRLESNVKAHNNEEKMKFELSLSVGVARFDPHNPIPIDTLLLQADKRMYQQKQAVRKGIP